MLETPSDTVFDACLTKDPLTTILRLRRVQAFQKYPVSSTGYLHFLFGGQFFKLKDHHTAYRHFQECHRLTRSRYVAFFMCYIAFAMACQRDISDEQCMLWIHRAMRSPAFEVAGTFLKAKRLLESGHKEEALHLYVHLSNRLPTVETSIICARLYAELGQFPMTSIYLQVARQRDPTHAALPPIKELLDKLALQCKQEATVLLHSKKYSAAIHKVHQGLELVPDDFDLILIKGEVLMYLKKEKEAFHIVKEADSLAAKKLRTKILLAWARRLIEKEDYADALSVTKSLASYDASYVSLQFEVYIYLKQYKEVIELKSLASPSHLNTAYFELGKEMMENHQWKEAIEYLEQSWTISRSVLLGLLLANACIHVDKAKAVAYLEEVLILDPDNSEAKSLYHLWVGQFHKPQNEDIPLEVKCTHAFRHKEQKRH